jgi:hypothetical protein
MNNKAGTIDLNDEDIVDADVIVLSSDSEDLPATVVPLPSKTVKVKTERDDNGPITRRLTQNHTRSKSDAGNLLKTLSSTLDPNVQLARKSERNAQSLQMAQYLSLSSQLRDAQKIIESLRSRLADAEHQWNAAERRADHCEMMLLVNNIHAMSTPPHKHYPSGPLPPPCRPQWTSDTSSGCLADSYKTEPTSSSSSTRQHAHDIDANPITPPLLSSPPSWLLSSSESPPLQFPSSSPPSSLST